MDPCRIPDNGLKQIIFCDSIDSGPTIGAFNHAFNKNRYLLAIGVNSNMALWDILSKQLTISTFKYLIYGVYCLMLVFF